MVAAVYGPSEVSQRKELSDRAVIEVSVKPKVRCWVYVLVWLHVISALNLDLLIDSLLYLMIMPVNRYFHVVVLQSLLFFSLFALASTISFIYSIVVRVVCNIFIVAVVVWHCGSSGEIA